MLKTVWHPKTDVYSHSSGGHWNWAFGGQKPKKYPSVETTFFQMAKGEKEEPLAPHWEKEIGLHPCSAFKSSPNQPMHMPSQREDSNEFPSLPSLRLTSKHCHQSSNKHFKSKSKAIKTLLTLSLLPQAKHKLPEFTFAGGEGERCWVLNPNVLACFLYCFSFSPLSPFGTVIN